jgi:hypothetical protein
VLNNIIINKVLSVSLCFLCKERESSLIFGIRDYLVYEENKASSLTTSMGILGGIIGLPFMLMGCVIWLFGAFAWIIV